MVACGNGTPAPVEEPSRTGYDPSNLFLPSQKQPELTTNETGIHFHWPGEEWHLFKHLDEFSAFDQSMSLHVHLQLARQNLKADELEWRMDEWSTEEFLIQGLEPLMEGILLWGKNGEEGVLVHLQNLESGQHKILTRVQEGVPQHLISQDRSKVAYVHPEEGRIAAYHTVTGRITVLSDIDPDHLCGEWNQYLRFSPLGGYITVEKFDCEKDLPIQFTTYGADSGRLIHQPIPGVNPRWDPEERTIAFILNPSWMPLQKDNANVPSEEVKEEETVKSSTQEQWVQIGVYSLERRGMNFLNRVPDGYQIVSIPVFSQNEAFLLFAIGNEKEQKLVAHHLERQVQQTLVLPESSRIMPGDEWCNFTYPQLIVPVLRGEDPTLFFYHYEMGIKDLVDSVSSWGKDSDSEVYLSGSYETGYYYLQEGRLMHADRGNHRMVADLPTGTNLKEIVLADSWLALVLLSETGEKSVQFISL